MVDLGPVARHDDLAEHHLDQPLCRRGQVQLSYHLPLTHDGDSLAQLLDLFELVGDEDDDHPLGGKFAKGGEEVDSLDLLALHEALLKLAEKDARKTKLVELRFFAGLTNAQAAEVLGISASTADEDWRYAKSWLRVEMGEAGHVND